MGSVSQIGSFIVVMDAKPNRNKLAERDRRDSAGLCVNCGCKPEAEDERKRGNCGKCYGDYRSARFALPEDKRVQFDAACIRDCKLMPDRQGQRLDKVNSFKAIADEVK